MTRRIPRSLSVRSLHQLLTTIDHPTRSSFILSVPAAGTRSEGSQPPRLVSHRALFPLYLKLTTTTEKLSSRPAPCLPRCSVIPAGVADCFLSFGRRERRPRSEGIPAPSIPARNSVDHLHLQMNVILNPACGRQAVLFAGEGSQPPRLATTPSDSFLFT